jgi:hypothetical protein
VGTSNRAHVQRLVAGVQDENLLHPAAKYQRGTTYRLKTGAAGDLAPLLRTSNEKQGPVLGWRSGGRQLRGKGWDDGAAVGE